jgi:hypothetical protein
MIPALTQSSSFISNQPEIRDHSSGVYFARKADNQLVVVTVETLATLAFTNEVSR